MEIDLPAGKYVVAVSGGVDSVVLLDLLAQKSGLELIVAHFDHGIRLDSSQDRRFVGELAERYGLPFVFVEGKLGPNASEALAREKRYEFLEAVRLAHGAAAIVTAHHQDDMLETAIINLLRGTNRRGLSSLKETTQIKRPLLMFPKADIKNHARNRKLAWHEDPTNTDTKYLRNYVRRQVLPRLDRARLLAIVKKAADQNATIDALLEHVLVAGMTTNGQLDRQWFAGLPDEISREVMAAWLRANGRREFDAVMIKRLAAAAQTAATGKRFDAGKGWFLYINRNDLALVPPER